MNSAIATEQQMFNRPSKVALQDALAQATAISRSQAVIEFNLDGTIVTANDNFLGAVGYALDEIKGKHHSIFVDAATRDSAAYRDFWSNLNRGQFQAAQYKRVAKGGREIWIEASYNPIMGKHGTPFKVIKFATDITARKIESLEAQGKVAAINRSQAVIEFNLDGTIVASNDLFLNTVGYTRAEVLAATIACSSRQPSATALHIATSGRGSAAASIRRPNIAGSARLAARSTSRRPIIRSSISTACRSRW
jgi:methyl-accepting chemotaxis protein